MTGEWKEKTHYFTVIEETQLQEVLDEMLVDIVGYDKEDVWILEDVCRHLKYLENSNVAINIQISNPAYVHEGAVLDFVNQEDFDLAKYYFQTNEFLTQEEYNALADINAIKIKE